MNRDYLKTIVDYELLIGFDGHSESGTGNVPTYVTVSTWYSSLVVKVKFHRDVADLQATKDAIDTWLEEWESTEYNSEGDELL